ncbi:MAG TPA: hypothetical protein VMJ32_04920 [Pirellulales bacterium]|nr:hypothetical protein [Pirellulales bacterium]
MHSQVQHSKNSFLAQVALFALFCVAVVLGILLLPLAAIVLLVAWIQRKRHPDGAERSTGKVKAVAEMVWLLAVMGAGMVLNIVVLPIGLFWYWIRGKPLPPPPEIGPRD